MASMRFTGAALDVADIWKLVVAGAWLAGETITLTVGSKSIVLTLGATVTTASIATALTEMWNGSAITGTAARSQTGNNVPEMAEAAASIGATTSTALFKMATPGRPIVITKATDSVGGTLTLTNPTPATGSEWWDNAANWDGGVLPADADVAYFDSSSASVRYGLGQSAIQLAELHIALSYTGEIGLPEINAAGGYHEYRSQYLTVGPLVLKVGEGVGNGSGRLKINSGTDPVALTVYATGSSADELPAFIWKGTSAANSLVQTGGSVGVAMFGGEVATLATVNKSDGSLLTSSGVTLSGALAHKGGNWAVNSAVATSLVQTGGATVLGGTGAVAQLTVNGGAVVYSTTGTLGGATVVSGDGVLDFSQNPVGKTVSAAVDLFGTACRIFDPLGVVASLVVDGNSGADPGTQVVWGSGASYRLTRGPVA